MNEWAPTTDTIICALLEARTCFEGHLFAVSIACVSHARCGRSGVAQVAFDDAQRAREILEQDGYCRSHSMSDLEQKQQVALGEVPKANEAM